MTSSGWQGRKDFPYNHSDLKCNLRIDSLTHSGDTLRVQGVIGAVDINDNTQYHAWYDYPVYVTPQGGSEIELLSGGEGVYGGGENNAKTVGFDVTIPVSASATSTNFSVHVRMNNSTSTGDLAWELTFDASVTPSKWYVSVNNSRKRAKAAYCSVNNTRKRIKKIYGSVNGARALCYEDPNL